MPARAGCGVLLLPPLLLSHLSCLVAPEFPQSGILSIMPLRYRGHLLGQNLCPLLELTNQPTRHQTLLPNQLLLQAGQWCLPLPPLLPQTASLWILKNPYLPHPPLSSPSLLSYARPRLSFLSPHHHSRHLPPKGMLLN